MKTIAALTLALVLIAPAFATAQAPPSAQLAPTPPVDLAELQRLGSLTPAAQRQNPNQAALRRWFQHNIEVYRHAADGTFLGRAAALVNPGPQAYPNIQGAWGQIWAPAPDWHNVVWDDRANPGVAGYPAPLDWLWPPEIGFGRQQGQVSANGGFVNTCWHEALHAILGQWALDEINLNAFQDVQNGGFEQEVREHAYINWAERTIDWISALGAFEALAREAAAEQERYRSNGVPVNWAVEHFIWRNAWVRWSGLQTSNFGIPGAGGGKIAAAMTPGLRDRFFGYTGIRLPLRAEVVRFYMTGGVTNDPNAIRNGGTPILVPEWVLVPDYRHAKLVQIDTTPAAPTCRVVPAGSGQSATCTFGVDLIDSYSLPTIRSVRAGVARGVLRVGLLTPGDVDPDARVEVRLAGQDLSAIAKRVGSAVEIDLPSLYRTRAAVPFSPLLPNVSKPIALEVEFVRGKVELLKADRQYKLSLQYRDADDVARGPAVYYDAEAVFFVTIHATPGATPIRPTTQPLTPSPAKPAPPGVTPPTTPSVTQPAAPATPTATGPGWYLVGRTSENPRTGYPLAVSQDGFGNTQRGEMIITEASDTTFAYRTMSGGDAEHPGVDLPKHYEMVEVRRCSWSIPPPFLDPGSTLAIRILVDTTGSTSTADPARFKEDPTTMSGLRCGCDIAVAVPPYPPASKDWTQVTGQVQPEVSAVNTPQQFVFTLPRYDPGGPGRDESVAKRHLSVMGFARDLPGVEYVVRWEYEYRGAATATAITADVTREADAPVAPDPDIDNEPPLPPPPPPPPPPPRKRQMAGVWYTHPTGDWRIWLRKGSLVTAGTPDADFDDISASIKGMRLRIWRNFETVSAAVGGAATAAQGLAAKQAKLLADSPGSTATGVKLGAATGIVVKPADSTGERRWEYWFAWGERLYRAEFVRSAEATLAVPALPGTSMLGTIEILRSRPGSAEAPPPPTPPVTPAKPPAAATAPPATPPAAASAAAALLVKQGQDLYGTAKYADAVTAYSHAIETDPNSADAYAGRGLAKHGLQDDDGALADLNHALQVNPRSADAYRGLSMIKRAKNDFAGALADGNRAVELAPGQYRAYLTRGLARQKLNDAAGALADFDRAIQLAPDYVASYSYRGSVRLDLKDNAGALADYTRFLASNPNDSSAFNNRGVAKDRLGDTAGALADFEKAVALNPANDAAKKNVDRVKARLGRGGNAPVPPAGALPASRRLSNNLNVEAVQNGGTPMAFRLDRPTVVTLLQTYHWNNGRGTPAPGEISLRDERGKIYGPWKATGASGQGGTRNALWNVSPNLRLGPGTYTVLDSDPATWSQNRGSKGAGMTLVEGYDVSDKD